MISIKNGVIRYKFVCLKYIHIFTIAYVPSSNIRLRHPSISIVHAWHDTSTTNLKNHATKCAPVMKGAIEEHIPGAKYSKAWMRFKIMQWVARQHRPYTTVEDPELPDIFHMLYAKVEVPSARSISWDVQEVFKMLKQNVILMLKVCCLLSFLFTSWRRQISIPRKSAHRSWRLDVTECVLISRDHCVHAVKWGACFVSIGICEVSQRTFIKCYLLISTQDYKRAHRGSSMQHLGELFERVWNRKEGQCVCLDWHSH